MTLGNSLGDNRLIVAGGLDDQPAGEWLAAQEARYLWWLIEQAMKGSEATKFLKPSDRTQLDKLNQMLAEYSE